MARLTTLSERRHRGDRMETFKTMRGINRVNRDVLFRVQVEEKYRPTRSNTTFVGDIVERMRELIVGRRTNLEGRRNSVSKRVGKILDMLPGHNVR